MSLTHCKHGHEFTPENTGYARPKLKRGRRCKTCQRIRLRIEAGWTREEAERTERVRPGFNRYGQAVTTVTRSWESQTR